MRKLTSLLDKGQLSRYLVQNRLLEYPSVQQEKQLKTGLRIIITAPGEIYQVTEMASFLQADHVRKELMTCIS
jgi:hypothetical protein